MVDSVYSSRYRRFRELLIAARKAEGLSQAALADRLGWVQTAVSKYERGERRLDVIEFLDIADALGLDPVKLVRKLIAKDMA